MLPAMLLSYFVALSAVLIVAISDLGTVGILVTFAFVFWVERELYALSKLVETGEAKAES